jgi:hypothetical protein
VPNYDDELAPKRRGLTTTANAFTFVSADPMQIDDRPPAYDVGSDAPRSPLSTSSPPTSDAVPVTVASDVDPQVAPKSIVASRPDAVLPRPRSILKRPATEEIDTNNRETPKKTKLAFAV